MEKTSKVRYCGCGAILPPNVRVCAPCKVANYARAVAAQNEAKTGAPQAEYGQIELTPPWVPRPKPPPLMTNEEQQKIDRTIENRLNERAGYGHGEVRTLSKKEIAAIAAQLTPPRRAVGPAVSYYDRRATEGRL